jgi:dihydropteroate synthase
VAQAGVPCVVMHIRGRPKTMQRKPEYQDLMAEVIAGLEQALGRGEKAGVKRGQMIVDPGIGFGKTAEHNLEILRRLGELRTLGRPILVGPSRKSFLGKVLGLEPEQRLEGSLAAAVLAAARGAGILRVHDVEQTVRALRVADAIPGRAGEGG